MQAVPTEYRGVRFKSKSEAILARAIDLRFSRAPVVWFYEPQRWLDHQTGYAPDFEVVSRGPAGECWADIFEYKPYAPTETYLSGLRYKFNRLSDKARLCGVNVTLSLIVGSVFDGAFVEQEFRDGEFVEVSVSEHLFEKETLEQARQYRFDLKGAA